MTTFNRVCKHQSWINIGVSQGGPATNKYLEVRGDCEYHKIKNRFLTGKMTSCNSGCLFVNGNPYKDAFPAQKIGKSSE